MTEIRKGEVALRIVDLETGKSLGTFSTGVVPRVGEFMKVDGKTRPVFDVEHELDDIGPRFGRGGHTIHRVTVRLSSVP